MPGTKSLRHFRKLHAARNFKPALSLVQVEGQDARLMQGLGACPDENWDAVAKLLRRYFGLPDLETRKGYKQVHANFETVSRRLDAAFEAAMGDDSAPNVRMRGGIAMIYHWMCLDSILRDKLLTQGQLPCMFVFCSSSDRSSCGRYRCSRTSCVPGQRISDPSKYFLRVSHGSTTSPHALSYCEPRRISP